MPTSPIHVRSLAAVIIAIGTLNTARSAEASDDLPAPAERLHFVEVAAEASGLAHAINSDPEKYGTVKWPWMSPLVDINGDGHLDILICGHHGGTGPGGEKAEGAAAVWLGRGDGTFSFDQGGYHRRWNLGARDPIWIDLTGNGAMDAIAAEAARMGVGRILFNDGSGRWQVSNLSLKGGTQFVDTNGDGRFDGVWSHGAGVLRRMDPPLSQWRAEPPPQLALTEVWNAEQALGWPEGVDRGRFGGWREAYTVDLTGDDRNELIVQVQGPGFHSTQLRTWVLTRRAAKDGQDGWMDTTAERGLPTDVGHCLFPEDIDVDGNLDLVDLATGHWYQNDGRGKFTRSPHRIFDPQNRRRPAWTPDSELEWADLTNNGFRDLITGVAHAGSGSGVFLNLGGGEFTEAEGVPAYGRGKAFGDVDGDHRLDMVSHDKGRVALHRNETPYRGLHVSLVPSGGAEASLGAKLWVYEAGNLGDQAKLVHYRQGFQTQRSNRSNVISADLHVGLREREAVDIRVRFPSGEVREVRNVKAESRAVVHEAGRD